MAKLKLSPDEVTFPCPVVIPTAWGDSDPVNLVFKYRTKPQIEEWMAQQQDRDDVLSIMDCVTGWDIPAECNADNVKLLCDNYPGSAFAIVNAYLHGVRGARVKN